MRDDLLEFGELRVPVDDVRDAVWTHDESGVPIGVYVTDDLVCMDVGVHPGTLSVCLSSADAVRIATVILSVGEASSDG